MRVFAIGENAAELGEFRDVFGMRFVGLVDSSGVYATYRVPNPQAPYPQDYVVDQQGIVRYWSDQFDPQEVVRVIDRLLGAGFEESTTLVTDRGVVAGPNPFRSRTAINLAGVDPGLPCVAVYSAAGRLIRTLAVCGRGQVSWDGRDETGKEVPAGIYYCCGPAAARRPLAKLARLE